MKRRRTNSTATTTGDVSGDTRSAGLGQIAILTLAIISGVAGFAFALFWIGSLILLGILWGTMAVEHQQQAGRRKGVLADVVGIVVDEAKDVAGSARGASHESSDS